MGGFTHIHVLDIGMALLPPEASEALAALASAGVTPEHLLVISPHLDDAVFSTWWHLRHAQRVTVCTVFAGVPPDGTLPGQYDRLTRATNPSERVRARRGEDQAVMARHGWIACHLDFLDEPYRTEPEDHAGIVAALRVLRGGTDLVMVPAGIGGHGDHRAARDAALSAFATTGSAIRLYADLPYAAMFGWPHWVRDAKEHPCLDVHAMYEDALSTISGWQVLAPEIHRLDADEQRAKLAAIRSYTTQFVAQDGGPSRWLSHPQRIKWEVSWPVERAGVGER